MEEEQSTESTSELQPPPSSISAVEFQSQLEELKEQANGKLHWERTPQVLAQVWDIFAANKSTMAPSCDGQPERSEAEVFLDDLADKAEEFRSAALHVHTRWVNLQSLLEELLGMQDTTQLHAQRTPQLLQAIESEVEGLNAVYSKAWQQLSTRWKELESALEELVAMKERNKLHLVRASQLLYLVSRGCSKGLSSRHAEAVSDIQFRWTAITPRDGPLQELRLMEQNGLHWRRTPELLQLLDEHCEGFGEGDTKTLKAVRERWEKMQRWLDEAAQMQLQDTIDCKATALILKDLNLLDHVNMPILKQSVNSQGPSLSPSSSPVKKREGAFAKLRMGKGGSTAPDQAQADQTSPVAAAKIVSTEHEHQHSGRLNGLVEWYAIEEAKHELTRTPYYRITTNVERDDAPKFSLDGQDSRLRLVPEQTSFTPENVRCALVDRGMIPRTCVHPSLGGSANVAISSLPKDLREEIFELEAAIENEDRFPYVLANRERLAELHLVLESVGKRELLQSVDHVVNTNKELQVPSTLKELMAEMSMRQLPTGELEDLMRVLTTALRKKKLKAIGIDVQVDASDSEVEKLKRKHQIKDEPLPEEIAAIQTQLQELGIDSKGEPVYLRGARIGTRCSDSVGAINTDIGVIDSLIEALRRCLLIEALRKRSSLVKVFTGETDLVPEQETLEVAEVNASDDFMELVERFQQLLIHESYTKRLAEYAALDRCMRAFVGASRDQIVTKEDITAALERLNKDYQLPVESFTREEHLEIAVAGEVCLPSQHNLARCPRGRNAKAMASYAAMSYAAMFYQDTAPFRDRLNVETHRLKDAFLFEDANDCQAMSASRRQRLTWASAAFTLRNRWFQRGFGWCDSKNAAGVKILLQSLLVVEGTSVLHMGETNTLLREISESCVNLGADEKAAGERLAKRYDANLKKLKDLKSFAEKCSKNQKFSSKDALALLSVIEKTCVAPDGLSEGDKEAYGILTSLRKESAQVDAKADEVRAVERKNSAGADPNDAPATAESDKKSLSPSKETAILGAGDLKSPLKAAAVVLEPKDKDALPKQAAVSEPNSLPPLELIVAPSSSRLNPESPRRKSTLSAKLKAMLRSPSKRAMASPEPTASIR